MTFCEASSHKLPKEDRPSRMGVRAMPGTDGKEGGKPIDHRFRARKISHVKWKI